MGKILPEQPFTITKRMEKTFEYFVLLRSIITTLP